MALFANTVVEDHRIKAWVCVISLYSVPTLFFAYQSRAIWLGEPSMQTSMSSSWGGLPTFLICAGEGGGAPHLYHKGLDIYGFQPRTNPARKDRVSYTSFSSHSTLGSQLGKCIVINATGREPLGGMRRSSVTVDMYVQGAKPTKHISLLSLDHNAVPKLQVLTAIVPGNTLLELRKIRKGWIGTHGPTIKDELQDAVTQFLEPTLKDSYSTQLSYAFPDLEMESWKVSNETLKKLEKLSPMMAKKAEILRQTPKQNFKFTMNVAADHVMEQVEIGRIPQLLYLLSRIGGYMSLLSLILHFIFVKRYPDSKVVQTYEAKTLLWSDDARDGAPDNHTKSDPRQMETA